MSRQRRMLKYALSLIIGAVICHTVMQYVERSDRQKAEEAAIKERKVARSCAVLAIAELENEVVGQNIQAVVPEIQLKVGHDSPLERVILVKRFAQIAGVSLEELGTNAHKLRDLAVAGAFIDRLLERNVDFEVNIDTDDGIYIYIDRPRRLKFDVDHINISQF